MRLISEICDELEKKQREFDKTGDVNEIRKVLDAYLNLMNETPDDPRILGQLAIAYQQLGMVGIAANLYYRALAQQPANSELWSNLGCCYRVMHQLPKARDCFMKSLMCADKASTYVNLASAYVNENCPEKGIVYAEKSMKMDAENPKCKWNAALLYLEMQDWKRGFTLYDAGLFAVERPMRFYSNDKANDVPWWDGSEGKTVVLYDEQGMGDCLLSYNLLRKIQGKGKFIVECRPRLDKIFRRSFPWVDHVFPTSKEEHLQWPSGFKLDAKIAIMSLAKLYWTSGEFDRTPYIIPNPELVAKYKEEFRKLGPGPYIAVSWAGGAPKTNTAYRTLKLNQLKPLIECGGTWISVQYHDWAKGKVEKFREESKLPLYHTDAAQEHDYDHSLAALAACDLTISACNTVIHTCGAAGLPCWVMVPARRAWRYPKQDHFPWYGDHLHMFHQSKDGDWDSVVKEVAVALKGRFFS